MSVPSTPRGAVHGEVVLHVTTPGQFGGLERVVHSLASSQRRMGIDARVAAFVEAGAPESALLSQLRDSQVPLTVIALPPRSYRAQLRALQRLCTELGPQVVHTHGYVMDVLAAMGISRRVPLVSTVHGFTGGDWKNRAYEILQRQAYRRFGGVIAVSRQLGTDLAALGVRESRLHVVPNAFAAGNSPLSSHDARASLEIAPGVFSIGWVGRISREKGLDVLIDALPRLRDLPVHLTVLGDGAERESVERRIEELSVGHLVTLAGARPDAAAIMRAFDVLVISSRTEGTPITLFEAMHALVPIVSTRVGGIPDVVTSSEALLVASESPFELADALRIVHTDKVSAFERAKRAGDRLVRDFGPGPWVDAHTRIYAGL